MASPSGEVEEFSAFVFNFVSKKFGLDSIVKQAGKELLDAIKLYRVNNRAVALFGMFLSPYYSITDLMFYSHARNLVRYKSRICFACN